MPARANAKVANAEVANAAEARAKDHQWYERRRKRRAETAEAVRGDWLQVNKAAAASSTPWGKRHKGADGTGDSDGLTTGRQDRRRVVREEG